MAKIESELKCPNRERLKKYSLRDGFNLLLGGGSALGFAHIGVIEFLDEKNLTPKSYHGVSMGAIIASVEALGLTKKEKNSLYNTVFNSLKWIRPKFNGSLISTSKIEELLDSIFKNLTFSDLYRELSIIATNYHTGELTIFNRYNNIKIKDAILASIAVPSLFPPRKIGNELFVDGYVSSNLPLQSVDNNLINLIVNITGKRAFKNLSDNELNSLSILGNLERSIRILIYNQTKVALKNFNREYILIEPDVSNYKTLSFNKFKEIKELGYKEAKESLCKKMKIQ